MLTICHFRSFEASTGIKISKSFPYRISTLSVGLWDIRKCLFMTSCRLGYTMDQYGWISAPAFKLISCAAYFFDPKYVGAMFLRNVGWHSTDYTALYTRRWYTSSNTCVQTLGTLVLQKRGTLMDIIITDVTLVSSQNNWVWVWNSSAEVVREN
jgi:hypothetical protein